MKKFKVVSNKKAPVARGAEIAVCKKCRRSDAPVSNAFEVTYLGGFIKGGRYMKPEKVLTCKHCFRRDGHIEVIAYL